MHYQKTLFVLSLVVRARAFRSKVCLEFYPGVSLLFSVTENNDTNSGMPAQNPMMHPYQGQAQGIMMQRPNCAMTQQGFPSSISFPTVPVGPASAGWGRFSSREKAWEAIWADSDAQWPEKNWAGI